MQNLVLDLSKHLIYEFYYDAMMSDNKLRLCYQNTCSLLYKIESEDIYKNIKTNDEPDAQFFYFSDYPKNHSFSKQIRK